MTYNVMTCGVGGQGLMLLSNIIGLACAESNLNIRTAETHGLAQRSGSIYTHIRVGHDIYSPLIPYGEADVLLGMEAIETLRYIEFLKPNGIVILNNYIWYPVQSTHERVKKPETPYINLESITNQLKQLTSKLYIIDALDIAFKAGNSLATNVVLLGALTHTKGFPLSIDQIERVLPQVVPIKALEANRKALVLGFNSVV
jgi:indolepyruvate ferredoxin oxidoreductase beta subunit